MIQIETNYPPVECRRVGGWMGGSNADAQIQNQIRGRPVAQRRGRGFKTRRPTITRTRHNNNQNFFLTAHMGLSTWQINFLCYRGFIWGFGFARVLLDLCSNCAGPGIPGRYTTNKNKRENTSPYPPPASGPWTREREEFHEPYILRSARNRNPREAQRREIIYSI